MVDLGNNLELFGLSVDMQEIAQAFNKAISNNFVVELRVEDNPKMSKKTLYSVFAKDEY